jgi:hypothetical protein
MSFSWSRFPQRRQKNRFGSFASPHALQISEEALAVVLDIGSSP